MFPDLPIDPMHYRTQALLDQGGFLALVRAAMELWSPFTPSANTRPEIFVRTVIKCLPQPGTLDWLLLVVSARAMQHHRRLTPHQSHRQILVRLKAVYLSCLNRQHHRRHNQMQVLATNLQLTLFTRRRLLKSAWGLLLPPLHITTNHITCLLKCHRETRHLRINHSLLNSAPQLDQHQI